MSGARLKYLMSLENLKQHFNPPLPDNLFSND